MFFSLQFTGGKTCTFFYIHKKNSLHFKSIIFSPSNGEDSAYFHLFYFLWCTKHAMYSPCDGDVIRFFVKTYRTDTFSVAWRNFVCFSIAKKQYQQQQWQQELKKLRLSVPERTIGYITSKNQLRIKGNIKCANNLSVTSISKDMQKL